MEETFWTGILKGRGANIASHVNCKPFSAYKALDRFLRIGITSSWQFWFPISFICQWYKKTNMWQADRGNYLVAYISEPQLNLDEEHSEFLIFINSHIPKFWVWMYTRCNIWIHVLNKQCLNELWI